MRYFFLTLLIVLLLLSIRRIIKPTYSFFKRRKEERLDRFKKMANKYFRKRLKQIREGDKCMELFMLKGEADSVSSITKDFQINKRMDTVKLVTL